jgi:hypothetical protein
MSSIIRKYWKWDERLNDTPYKLGLEINYLLQKGLVYPDKNEEGGFMGIGEGTPRHIRISYGKVDLVYFSFPSNSIFPKINEGLWEMEEPKFTETLNSVLGPPCEPTHGDYLFVVFRDFFVTAAAIFRRLPK